MNRIALIFMVWLACAVATQAQQPDVSLVLPTTTLEVGEVVNAQLICTNTGEPSLPRADTPPGLDVRLTNDTPALFQQQSIINGRRTSKTTYTFHLRLSAKKPGTYTLGPFSVEAGGTTHLSNAVQVSVRAAPSDAGPRGDRMIFAGLEVTPRDLYVTESYTATLPIGIRKVVIHGREYDVDLLRQVLDLGASEISVFAGGQANRSEQWLRDSNGQRHKYEVFRVTRRIRAEQSGQIEIGPIFLKANYPTAIRRGFFGRSEISRHRRETARADAIVVRVLDPPLDTRPPDFTGAIGRYTMAVDVKPNRIEKGQPVTLTITIKGRPVEGVAGPDLSAHAELTSRFDFTTDELVGDVEGGAKRFRRALFPRQAGEQTIPAITWSYFDTARETYVTLTSDPIDIVVDAPSHADEQSVTLDAPNHKTETTTLTVVSGGIMPNYVDPDVVLVDHAMTVPSPLAFAALVLPPFLCLGVTLTAKRRERMRRDIGYARASKAAMSAHRAIKRSLTLPDSADQLAGLAQALGGYISDRFNVGQGHLTADECRGILRERGFDDATIAPITDFLEQCDALRYAPSAAQAVSPREASKELRQWLRKLERGAS